MSPQRFQAVLSVLAACLLEASTALAVRSYPRSIKTDLGLNYEPPCSICHQYGKTGNGTPIEPLAWSLRARGLNGSRDTLSVALSADEADRVDSDGDGVPDVQELHDGTDPNSAANDCIIPVGTAVDAGQCTPGTQASPTLGCALGRAAGAPRSGKPWILGVVLMFAFARRARRRSSASTTS